MTPQIKTQPPVREDTAPWWHYGHVWLILGLLAFAVCASFGLLYAAIKIMETDNVYTDRLHPQDGSAPKFVAHPGLLPAEEGRNFAATGGVGAPHLKAPAANTGGAYAHPDN